MMRKLFPLLAVAVLFSGLALVVRAADDKEKTVTGEGACAKCSLKETKTCQNAVTVQEGGKKVTYYLTKNKVSNDFHKNVCQTTEKIKVTGTVKTEPKDGKAGEITPTKIELVTE
jgi:aspartyl/asparaginyl-tRNA synthetase